MKPICADKSLWKYELFEPFEKSITDFVTSRHGGYSEGNYATFNPSPYSGDDVLTVERNLQKLKANLPHPPQLILRPRQVHGIDLKVIDNDFLALPDEEQKQRLTGIDAICTDKCGYAVCVSTADCVPILLYDKEHGAIAAVHAGWRGTVKRILQHTLQQMSKLYGTEGSNVYAGIGPSISLESFEIGEEVYEAFQKANFDMSLLSMWNETTHKHHIDLWKANAIQLQAFGVPYNQIQIAGICTYKQHEDFFSARRLGIKSGRILSGILLNQS